MRHPGVGPRRIAPEPQVFPHRSLLLGTLVWHVGGLPCRAAIKYVSLSLGVQQLCSATVLDWHRNMVHDVDLSNLDSFAMPVLVLVILHDPRVCE